MARTDPTRRPDALPERHERFLDEALPLLREDERIVGVAAGGSFTTGGMDELSDLDLVLGVEPSAWPDILDRRLAIAGLLGPLLGGFTGEHVGEPRLLICLYGPPLLHVDLKFVSLDEVHERVEDPVILWERDGRLSEAFERAEARYPAPDPAWIEDRFWIWVHYGATKIERGEVFEALDMLAFLRRNVLGRLALEVAGARPDGVRRIERNAPEVAARLERCVASPDPRSCLVALEAAIELYADLRDAAGGASEAGHATEGAGRSAIEREVRSHVAELRSRLE